ncbi:uncharacterized protein LOC133206126 [Saccostrea echinata]|uniref:uncharacterized protein LOC133206126 n=1 Tax=Saccostrea echinata TaxID=191078 RepID=UPI002A819B04|nr:uncharacterized protein LOC133206126 [Saccostrea echinata]
MARVKITKKSEKRKELFPSGVQSNKVGKKKKVKNLAKDLKEGKSQNLGVVKSSLGQSGRNQSSTKITDRTHGTDGLLFAEEDTRKVIFTKDQMENWKPMSEELFDNVAKIIGTSKQFILNKSIGLYYDSVKTAMNLSEKRLLGGLKNLKVPHQQGKRSPQHFEGSAAEDLDKLELHGCELEFKISKQNDACDQLQEDLEKLKACQESSEVHPLLQRDFTPSLKLPKVKKMET